MRKMPIKNRTSGDFALRLVKTTPNSSPVKFSVVAYSKKNGGMVLFESTSRIQTNAQYKYFERLTFGMVLGEETS